MQDFFFPSQRLSTVGKSARHKAVIADTLNATCPLLSSALFVDLEADFHARVPVVICKEKKRYLRVDVVCFGFCYPHIKKTVAYIRVVLPHVQEQLTTNETVLSFFS